MIFAIKEFTEEYRFLSNFWPAKVEFEGVRYDTAEHAYQAAKSLHPDAREFIRNCGHAGEAKKHGKNLVLREDWEQVKQQVMLDVLRSKFTLNTRLQEKLLATCDLELIEGNRWGDKIWGVCLRTREGQNRLGKLLMQVREELNQQE